MKKTNWIILILFLFLSCHNKEEKDFLKNDFSVLADILKESSYTYRNNSSLNMNFDLSIVKNRILGISLKVNEMDSLSYKIKFLKGLEYLDLNNNRLSDLPDSLPQNLRDLSLRHNYFVKIPMIKSLDSLRSFDISNCPIDSGIIDTKIFPKSLKWLNISHTKIKIDNYEFIKSLTILYVDSIQYSEFDTGFKKLYNDKIFNIEKHK